MKLFTKEINDKLFAQYRLGSNLEQQVVVAKIFNPYGMGTWYLLNSDPEDPDYLWAIVDLFEVEVGSVSREDLETIRVKPFGLGLERDTTFQQMNAAELFQGLLSGKKYAKGGVSDVTVEETKQGAFITLSNAKPDDVAVQLEKGGGVSNMTDDEVLSEANTILHYEQKDYDEEPITDPQEARKFLEMYYADDSEEVQEYAFKKGGRIKSAIMRDRAYKSKEAWEESYKRHTSPKNPKYHYGKGGTTFMDKVKAIKARLLKNKKVSPKVQSAYGKTYSDKEAEEAAKRIAGAMRRDEKMEKGGKVNGEYVDLFQYPEKMPRKVSKIINRYWEQFEDLMDYSDTARMLKEVQAVGYTFDYELDNTPFGLRPLGVKLSELKGFEEFADEDDEKKYGGKMAKGGIVVTSIKDIPDLMKEIEAGRVTYRGLGMGKLSNDFYKQTGENGTRITVKGKEYFITDKEYEKLEWDNKKKMWKNRIKFAAPYRKS